MAGIIKSEAQEMSKQDNTVRDKIIAENRKRLRDGGAMPKRELKSGKKAPKKN